LIAMSAASAEFDGAAAATIERATAANTMRFMAIPLFPLYPTLPQHK
jgi:hypothetical protein